MDNPVSVAGALTAIHGTDPCSTVLGILARSPQSTIANVELALYEDRTLARVLGMRRTIFAVPYELAPSIWSAFDATVARTQRRLLMRMLAESGVTDAENWLNAVEGLLLNQLAASPGSTSAQIAEGDPRLSFRLQLAGPAGTPATQSVTSRLLTLLSAEGRVIRARPKGSWTSSQYTWAVTDHWRSDWPDRPPERAAEDEIVRSWLAAFGPATVDDLAWWTGWPKGRSRAALDRVGCAEVETSVGTAYLLASDLEPTETPASWVALLPALDSTTMGRKHRDFYLGPYARHVFDNVGNAGPTVWCNGHIVGGWAQHPSGEIRLDLFEDVGREAMASIEDRAQKLSTVLADVRIKPRARRYTASEIALMQE